MRDWIIGYCTAKPGTQHHFKEAFQKEHFLIGDTIYATLGDDTFGKPILTVRSNTPEAQRLYARYDFIVPGYDTDQQHWISVYLETRPAYDLLAQLLDAAYALALSSLPEKLQKETLGE